ncbi:MAG: 4Fe-4S dicluster domain-containing protein [Planctomycetota bacterium]
MIQAKGIEERVVLNMDRCIGCRSCSAACFYGHGGMPSVSYGVIAEGTLPVVCRQCTEPPCVEACPTDALEKDAEGVVQRSRMLCIGCRSCVLACPFGVISEKLSAHLAPKCDLCEDRLRAGEIPRCVAACTTGALRFEKVDKVEDSGLLLLSGRTVGTNPYKRR